MDGCKSMRMVGVITVLMVICAGCASASFGKCYGSCYADCVAANGEKTWCITKCLFKCIPKNSDSDSAMQTNYDCAVNRCARFGNDADKVEDCVTQCDNNKCAHQSPNSIGNLC